MLSRVARLAVPRFTLRPLRAKVNSKSSVLPRFRLPVAALVGLGAAVGLLSSTESHAEASDDVNCNLQLPANLDELVRGRQAKILAQIQKSIPAFVPLPLPAAPIVGQCYPAPDRSVSHTIDHTLLKPQATKNEISKLVQEAVQYRFAGVCVNSCNVAFARNLLNQSLSASSSSSSSPPLLVSVIGFPLGAMGTAAKVAEAEFAIAQGANELDMVINVGQLKDQDYAAVYKDIRQVTHASHQRGVPVKVILETCLLTPEEIIDACLLCRWAQADFVKTSTGFSTGGATIPAVQLMAAVVRHGDRPLQVKASGGVKSSADALAMIRAGATRIGTSNGIAIAQGLTPSDSKSY